MDNRKYLWNLAVRATAFGIALNCKVGMPLVMNLRKNGILHQHTEEKSRICSSTYTTYYVLL